MLALNSSFKDARTVVNSATYANVLPDACGPYRASTTNLVRPDVDCQRVASQRRWGKGGSVAPPQASAGSVFKNPPGDYSGRLIEAAGLKGTQIGKAQISPRHANFIVNLGGARAADITALIALARRTVQQQSGVELELEIELRGEMEGCVSEGA